MFASYQSIMQRDNVDFYNFYTFIKVECQKNSDVVENVLRCVLSNELFIKVVLLLLVLWVTYHMRTKCALKLCEMGFGYKAIVAEFRTKMS